GCPPRLSREGHGVPRRDGSPWAVRKTLSRLRHAGAADRVRRERGELLPVLPDRRKAARRPGAVAASPGRLAPHARGAPGAQGPAIKPAPRERGPWKRDTEPAAGREGTATGELPDPHAHTGWIERRLCVPGENEETRHRKVQFTIASILVVPAGILWGGVYILYGERGVAPFPIAYSVLTLLDLLLLFRLRRFELFRWVQQVLMFVLPIALQIGLGGFVGSSLVILWSFIAVLESLLFGGVREPRWWLAAFVAAVLGAALLQPGLEIRNHLPRPV